MIRAAGWAVAALVTAVVLLAFLIVLGASRKRTAERIAEQAARQRGRDIAYRIRAELVCCDLYDRVQAGELTLDEARENHWGHDLCYWGEAAAQLAEGRCPEYATVPNVCQCDCAGCASGCTNHVDVPAVASAGTRSDQNGDQT